MKRIIATLLSLFFLLPIPIFAEQTQDQGQQKYALKRLLLPNFVYPNCHLFKPADTVIFYLDERFYNSVGSNVAPTSCKGGSICWSWKVLRGEDPSNIQIYSSELPLKITNLKKLSESIATTIKESQSLRKSSNSLVSAAQEFLNSSFGAGKEKAVTKERSMTQSESRERATELNVTPQFHAFLSKAVMGPFVATYPFCIASAVDLFYKAYYSDRSDDLFQAFVIYKNVKPEDIDFSNQSIFLNRAKFLHSLLKQVTDDKDKPRQDAAWAQSVLFAKLLDWKEFEEVKHFVDSEIQKVYPKYQALTIKTTAEIASTDKNLAAIKYNADKNMKVDDAQLKQKQNEIRDEYLKASISSQIAKADGKEIAELERALAAKDPLVSKKFVQSTATGSKWLFFALAGGCFIFILAIILFKKKSKGGKSMKYLLIFLTWLFLASNSFAHEACLTPNPSFSPSIYETSDGLRIFVFANNIIDSCKITNPFNVCSCPPGEGVKECVCKSCYTDAKTKNPYPIERSWRKEVQYQVDRGGRMIYTHGNISVVFTAPWRGRFTLSYVSGMPFSVGQSKQSSKSSKKSRYDANTVTDSSISENAYTDSQQSSTDKMIRFIDFMTEKAKNQFVFYACPRRLIESRQMNIDNEDIVMTVVDWILHMHQFEPKKLKSYIREFEKVEKTQ